MSRHYEKLIERLTAPEPKPRRTEPRTRDEIESFVKGFGLSTAATKLVVAAWSEDVQLASESGWSEGYNSAEEYWSRG